MSMTSSEQEAIMFADLYNKQTKPLSANEVLAGYPECKECGNKRDIAVVRQCPTFGNWGISYKTCKCQNAIRSIVNINKSGLSELLNDFRFDNFTTAKGGWQKDMKDTAIAFGKSVVVEGQKPWLLMLGQSGSGKTHICTAVCGRFLARGLSVKYFRWGVEGKRLKAIVNEPEYAVEVDDIIAHDVICIDDLFKRQKGKQPTDADVKLAFELIDTAFAERKILIVSGEDKLGGLFAIDEAIGGRLKQNAGQYICEITGVEKNQRV